MLRDLAKRLTSRFSFGVTARATVCASLLLTGTACTKNNSQISATYSDQPTVISVVNQPVASPGAAALRMSDLKLMRAARASGAKVSAAFATTVSPIVASKVTFEKSAIFDRVFLYGTDLQYSSVGEEDGMLLQSMAVGHVTARFQVVGDRLQLMAEEKYRFESDINIPLRLLHEWVIVAQTPSLIIVDIEKASPALAGVFGSANPVRTSWVRSVEFAPVGSYLMMETSVELADGNIAEFMESLFPRDTLVTPATTPLFDDESLEPMAGRFGFLSNDVWTTVASRSGNGSRVKTAVANRFAMPDAGKTIDWYVTPNIPAEFIPAVRDGIEGWNRYSQKMFGRDFIAFKGILPAGIKIGDPRYNVVNWDSVLDASAAYESQASDPETGIQSHSLIYLPYAWVKIGREFWERGKLSRDRTAVLKSTIDKAQFLGRKVDVPCFNEAELGAISLKGMTDPDTFAKELLRGTLFHEVGHALGLAHNFKGSLTWNPDDAASMMTSSVMDYNQYQLEGSAFDASVGASGALLEYDRQILSVLYNGGKDITATDKVMDHCDDGVADSKAGGVDPLCIRYDAGQDPTVQLDRTLKLIQDPTATLGRTKSLAVTAERSLAVLGDATLAVSEAEVRLAEQTLRTQMLAVIQYYLSAGAQGLNYMMSANLRHLWTFKSGTLPATVDPLALRARVAMSMDEIMTLEKFSPATRTAFEKIGDHTTAWLKLTPWYGAAPQAARTEREDSFKQAAISSMASVEGAVLPRVRIRQIQGLARSSTAPFFMTTSIDYEQKALGWLELVLVKGLPSGATYTVAERVAAAQTLATFAGIAGSTAIKTAGHSKVETEIAKAGSAEERESLRALLALLL